MCSSDFFDEGVLLACMLHVSIYIYREREGLYNKSLVWVRDLLLPSIHDPCPSQARSGLGEAPGSGADRSMLAAA
jgi:hypothetical protein